MHPPSRSLLGEAFAYEPTSVNVRLRHLFVWCVLGARHVEKMSTPGKCASGNRALIAATQRTGCQYQMLPWQNAFCLVSMGTKPLPRSSRNIGNFSMKDSTMVDASQIKEHMEIKGSDGTHIGTVDRVEGDRIKLAKSDPASGGTHRYMDVAQVEEIKNGCVVTSEPAQACKSTLQ